MKKWSHEEMISKYLRMDCIVKRMKKKKINLNMTFTSRCSSYINRNLAERTEIPLNQLKRELSQLKNALNWPKHYWFSWNMVCTSRKMVEQVKTILHYQTLDCHLSQTPIQTTLTQIQLSLSMIRDS